LDPLRGDEPVAVEPPPLCVDEVEDEPELDVDTFVLVTTDTVAASALLATLAK